MRNDDAALAVIFGFVLAVGVIAFVWIVSAGIVDPLTVIHNNATQSGAIPLTQERQDSLLIQQAVFKTIPIIGFVLTILVAIVYAVSGRNQTV